MQQLTIILYSVGFGTMFVNAIGLPFRERLRISTYIGEYERIKPFDCEKCLSFWIAIWLGFNTDFKTMLLTASISYVLSIFVTKAMNK